MAKYTNEAMSIAMGTDEAIRWFYIAEICEGDAAEPRSLFAHPKGGIRST